MMEQRAKYVKLKGRQIAGNLERDCLNKPNNLTHRFKRFNRLMKDIPRPITHNREQHYTLLDVNGKSISQDRLMTSLERNDGRLLKVIKELRIASYNNLQRYLSTNADLDELQRYFKKKLVQKAEDVLFDSLEDDDKGVRLKASMFILETLGRNDYSKTQPLVNIDLRNNDQVQNQIKSIFGISDNSEQRTQIADQNIQSIDFTELNASMSNELSAMSLESENDLSAVNDVEQKIETQTEDKPKRKKYREVVIDDDALDIEVS